MIAIGNHRLDFTFQSLYQKSLASQMQASERLSSGKRINRAADDAANLSISSRIHAQITGTTMGSRNIRDGISLLQTAESGLQSIANLLQRMRELTLQASNSTYQAQDRNNLQQEIEQVKREIDKIAMRTQFNGRQLLGPSMEQIQTGGAMADIVFVIDNTASMSSIQRKVADNLAGFSEYLQQQGIRDVRFGILEYTDNEKNVSIFSNGQWTTDTTELKTEIERIATTNRGGTENALGALTEVVNQYTFRTNGANTVGHAILITDEKADDKRLLEATIEKLKDANIETHAIYDSSYDNDGLDEIGKVVTDTGGITVDIQSQTWGEQLKSILASKITASATVDIPFDNELIIHTGYALDHLLGLTLTDNRTNVLGIAEISVLGEGSKENQLEKIDAALEQVTKQMTTIGSYMNRLESIEANNQSSNTEAMKTVSKIVDADMAKEMSELVKARALQETVLFSMKQSQQTFSDTILALVSK